MVSGTSLFLSSLFQLLILFTCMFCFVNCGLVLNLLNSLYTCLYVAILVSELLNILEEIISYLEFSIMVNESEVIVGGGSSSGATAGAID